MIENEALQKRKATYAAFDAAIDASIFQILYIEIPNNPLRWQKKSQIKSWNKKKFKIITTNLFLALYTLFALRLTEPLESDYLQKSA